MGQPTPFLQNMEGVLQNMLNAKDLQLIQILINNGIEEIKAENGNYGKTIKAIHALQNLRNKVFIASTELPDRLPNIPSMNDW